MRRYLLLLILQPILIVIVASPTVNSQRTRPPAPQQEEALQDFSKQEIEAARKKGLPESKLVPYLRAKRQGIPQLKPGQGSDSQGQAKFVASLFEGAV